MGVGGFTQTSLAVGDSHGVEWPASITSFVLSLCVWGGGGDSTGDG